MHARHAGATSETDALEVKRFTRKDDDGNNVPIKTVLVSFLDSLPDTLYIGYNRHKVYPYVPQPMRCSHCQRFGHTKARCNKTVPTCPFCSQQHTYDVCPNKQDRPKALCVNCRGQHSSAYRGCPKYRETELTMRVRADKHLKFKDSHKLVLEALKNPDQPRSNAPQAGQKTHYDLNDKTTWPLMPSQRNPSVRSRFSSVASHVQTDELIIEYSNLSSALVNTIDTRITTASQPVANQIHEVSEKQTAFNSTIAEVVNFNFVQITKAFNATYEIIGLLAAVINGSIADGTEVINNKLQEYKQTVTPLLQNLRAIHGVDK